MHDQDATRPGLTDTVSEAIIFAVEAVAYAAWRAVLLRIVLFLFYLVLSLFFNISLGLLTSIGFAIVVLSRPVHWALAKEIWGLASRDSPSEVDPVLEFLMITNLTLTNIFSVVAYIAVGHFELILPLLGHFLVSKIFLAVLAGLVAWIILLRVNMEYSIQVLGRVLLSGFDIVYQLELGLVSRESMSGSTPYTYERLDPEKSEIRLIKITKSNPFSRPHYSLVTIDLSELVNGSQYDYDAMSYTWDEQESSVGFDGKSLRTTLNVKRILQQRGSCLRTTYVWIDAVCINQSNSEEKCSQIALMGTIYSHARRTLIWLENDKPRPSETVVIKLVLTLLGICKRYWADCPDLLDYVCLFVMAPGKCPSLERFLSHRYWGRAWVIQEIARGRQVHILYGTQLLDWGHVTEHLELVTLPPLHRHMVKCSIVHNTLRASVRKAGASNETANTITHRNKVIFLDKTRRDRSQMPIPLRAALEWSSSSEASVLNDKVFALRGLVLDDSDSTSQLARVLHADYKSSYPQVFTRVAEYLLSQDPEYLFRKAGLGLQRKGPHDSTHLPSWVPDWTRNPSVIELEHEPYRAGGIGNSNAEILDYGRIRVSVIEICTLHSLTPPLEPAAGGKLGMITSFYRSTGPLIESLPTTYLPTGQPRLEAFWRTLIGNLVRRTPTNPLEYPAPVEWNEKHHRWITSPLGPDGDYRSVVQPDANEDDFNMNFVIACQHRCFAIAEDGYMVLAPGLAEKGDSICVVPGLGIPLLFRRRDDVEESWDYIGACYVHGLMDGEALMEGKDVKTYLVP